MTDKISKESFCTASHALVHYLYHSSSFALGNLFSGLHDSLSPEEIFKILATATEEELVGYFVKVYILQAIKDDSLESITALFDNSPFTFNVSNEEIENMYVEEYR